MRQRKIDLAIEKFLARRDGPFTVRDVASAVGWKDSDKRLARFLVKSVLCKSCGTIMLGSGAGGRPKPVRLTLYHRVESKTKRTNLYGQE